MKIFQTRVKGYPDIGGQTAKQLANYDGYRALRVRPPRGNEIIQPSLENFHRFSKWIFVRETKGVGR